MLRHTWSDLRHYYPARNQPKLTNTTSKKLDEVLSGSIPIQPDPPGRSNLVSIREAVLIQGVLRGMNLEAQCVVRAVKVSLPKLDIWEYVAADVAQAPTDLPAGAYEVLFEGRKAKVHKTARGWTSEQA